MSKLEEFCRKKTTLTPVQIDLLGEIAPCLPFVADITGARLRLYVPTTEEKFVTAYEAFPNSPVIESGENLPQGFALYDAYPLVAETFRHGKELNQWQESDTGGVGVRSYPLTDFTGATIAVVILSFRLLLPMTEYAHLLHTAGAVLRYGRKFNVAVYGKLSAEDGILVADRFHRIVFADEVVRHIYRTLGVGSLVGRHLFAAELKAVIDRETHIKKAPWEKEITAGERILREIRLDFTEGGETKGHLVILTDITEQKRREQEAKLQAELMQRIQELENELTDVKNSLATRKLLDRAKGILQAKFGMTEEEAHRRIQHNAMMKRQTIKEVAEKILQKWA